MPNPYSPAQLKRALRRAGLNVSYEPGWETPANDPFGVSPSHGVIMHHTANGGARGDHPSLYWMMHNQYAPVRAAHFLVGRSGKVMCVASRGAYHAGAGGPVRVDGRLIPYNQGNKYLVGIEIESEGTSKSTKARIDEVDGYTPEQIEAASTLAAALCDLMGVSVKGVITHAAWTNGLFDGNPRLPTYGRKNDTLLSVGFWRRRVRLKMLSLRTRRLLDRRA